MTYSDIWLGDSIELVKKFKPQTIQSVITDPPFRRGQQEQHGNHGGREKLRAEDCQ